LLDLIFLHTGDLGISLVLLLAAQALRAGPGQTFTVGDFALFAAYLPFVTGFISYIGSVWARSRQTGVSIRRLVDLLAGASPQTLIEAGSIRPGEPLRSTPAVPEAEPFTHLEVVNLTYHYPNSERGVEALNFRLDRGTITVITGRVGSGKTTLLRTLLGLLPKAAGEIYWNGRPVEQPGRFFTPPRSAYTPQIPRLFSQTLRENQLLGLSESEVDLAEAIRLAVLEEDLAGLPQDLETRIGPSGVKFSGGQIQRTAAARMFARRPALLVFDDLASALDVATEKLLWERLFQARRAGQTCLAVSHRRAVWEQADQLIVLKEGRIEAAGSPGQLLTANSEFQFP
jgi:ATP-binding cassette subfamily B protein